MNQKQEPLPENQSAPATGQGQPAATAPADREPEIKRLQAELEAARVEAAANLDKFLRAKAETENIRRRAETDMAGARKYAVERFASEILAVRDSLEQAHKTGPAPDGGTATQQMRAGLELTLKLLDSVFQKFSMTMLDPQGEKFDPDRHMAVSVVESAEVAPNHIVSVVQKGCLLHDRVLRPAMVVVARARAEAAEKPPAAP